MTEQTSSELYAQSSGNREITSLNSKINELEMRIYNLEIRIPNSNIMSHKFWTRALAVFGHDISIVLAFYGGIIALMLGISAVVAILGSVFK